MHTMGPVLGTLLRLRPSQSSLTFQESKNRSGAGEAEPRRKMAPSLAACTNHGRERGNGTLFVSKLTSSYFLRKY